MQDALESSLILVTSQSSTLSKRSISIYKNTVKTSSTRALTWDCHGKSISCALICLRGLITILRVSANMLNKHVKPLIRIFPQPTEDSREKSLTKIMGVISAEVLLSTALIEYELSKIPMNWICHMIHR